MAVQLSVAPHARLVPRTLFAAVLATAVLFRLPALLNAPGMSSDATIVGLQADHMRAGEWSWFLWGAGYQSSFDALLAAVAFTLAGSHVWTLMAVPLVGHLILLWLAFAVLRKRVDITCALILLLPLVFTPRAINSVTVYPPRQWCITCVFAAIWLLDGAGQSRRPLLRCAAGAFASILALYFDLFALQFVMGVGFFAIACSLDGKANAAAVLQRVGACAIGAAGGLSLLWLLRQSPHAASHAASLTVARIAHNLALLRETCLPWLLSYKVFTERGVTWQPPAIFRAVQIAGAGLLVLSMLFGGAALFLKRLPWSVRRFGGLGFMIAGSSLGGFLVSSMPVDQYSARYLAPIVWAAPFVLAPAAYLLRTRRFGLLVAPYLVAAAVGGWLSFGPFVHGALPTLTPPGSAQEETQLGTSLRRRGIEYAAADYWQAYRLTFLWHEQPVVVPLNPGQDRYAPYRRAFNAARVVAYIFDPSQPQAKPEAYEEQLRRAGTRYERLRVGRFTALIVHKQS